MKEKECCKEFNPKPWDDVFFEWEHKQFIRKLVCTFMYMPLNFRRIHAKLNSLVSKNHAQSSEYFYMSEHVSRQKMYLYVEVIKPILHAKNIIISGKFYSKVYEGSFKNMPRWKDDFSHTLKQRDIESERTFYWYTTCPHCVKKYKKNYVVFIAEILKT